jgi:AhpD family alkylhydroperoxidase
LSEIEQRDSRNLYPSAEVSHWSLTSQRESNEDAHASGRRFTKLGLPLVEEGDVMAHYHDENDLLLLKDMAKLAPEEFKAWLALDRIVTREDGHIPRKFRELIALAVAHTSQCVYCIEAHAKGAKAGATREEVAETALFAAALRAGGAAAHGALALKFFDQAR